MQGSHRLLIIDRAGARAIAKIVPDAVLIWISPPSIDVLRVRLQVRGTENQVQIERRIALAREEMEEEAKNPLYSHTIVNDLFEKTLIYFENVVNEALF